MRGAPDYFTNLLILPYIRVVFDRLEIDTGYFHENYLPLTLCVEMMMTIHTALVEERAVTRHVQGFSVESCSGILKKLHTPFTSS